MGYLGNSGTTYLLLQIVLCWREFEVDEENWDISMVLYCSFMMYKYYQHIGFLQIKHNKEGKYTHNEIFNNIPHLIKNHLHLNSLQDGFFIYTDKVLIHKR